MAKDDEVTTIGEAYKIIMGEGRFSLKEMKAARDFLKEMNDLEKDINLISAQQVLQAKDLLEVTKSQANVRSKIKELRKEAAELSTKEDFVSKAKLEIVNKEIAQLNTISSKRTAINRKNERSLRLAREQVAAAEKLAGDLDKQADRLGKIETIYGRIIKAKPRSEAKDFVAALAKAAEAYSKVDFLEMVKETSAENIALQLLTGMQGITYTDVFQGLGQFVNNMDTFFASMVRGGIPAASELKNIFQTIVDPIEMASGRLQYIDSEFASNLMLKNLGIGGEEANKALVALKENVALLRNSFIAGSKEATMITAHIGSLTAGLAKLGVTEENTAQMFDFLIEGLKQTPMVASESVRSLANIAHSLDVNVGQSFQDFLATQSTLAQFGDRNIEVFGGLLTQATATGVAVTDLAGVADRLDTFQGAARAAQGFNAILGDTVLSVTDLVHADPEEKILLLQQALDRSGISFDTAHRRIRTMLADLLGMSVADASKMFGNQEDYFTLKSSVDDSALSMKDLDERVLSTMTNAERMTRSLSSLGVAAAQALERGAANANKAAEQQLTLVASLGQNVDRAEEILYGFYETMLRVSQGEAFATRGAEIARGVAGYSQMVALVVNALGQGPAAARALHFMEKQLGVDFMGYSGGNVTVGPDGKIGRGAARKKKAAPPKAEAPAPVTPLVPGGEFPSVDEILKGAGIDPENFAAPKAASVIIHNHVHDRSGTRTVTTRHDLADALASSARLKPEPEKINQGGRLEQGSTLIG